MNPGVATFTTDRRAHDEAATWPASDAAAPNAKPTQQSSPATHTRRMHVASVARLAAHQSPIRHPPSVAAPQVTATATGGVACPGLPAPSAAPGGRTLTPLVPPVGPAEIRHHL